MVPLWDFHFACAVRDCRMRMGMEIAATGPDKERLEAIVSGRSSPQKHVWRARIILLTAQSLGTHAIMAATGKSKPCVWRWQERFMAEGVEGLLRDKTQPPSIAPLDATVIGMVVKLTLEPPTHEATHWTVRAMAKAVGIAASTVEDLARSRPCTASLAQLQAVQRQGLRRKAPRRCRALRLAARSCHRALG